MKQFLDVSFSAVECQRELAELGTLISAQDRLLERQDILPFFRERRQLSAFIGTYAPDVGPADLLAYEFEIAGDFAADLIVGSRRTQTFCLVEMEDARPYSVFAKPRKRTTTEWSRTLEKGFGQIVDWFYALDDLKGTERFARDFGYGQARFHGLLIIGRSNNLSEQDRNRLRWRGARVLVNSHPVACITYDELVENLTWRLGHYAAASASDVPADDDG